MKRYERYDYLLSLLVERPVLSVAQAVQLSGASYATVRRDFDGLAREGLVERVRGGVRRKESGGMLSFSLREARHSAEKARLARAAARRIKAGQVIMIDGGTTTFMLASCLPDVPMRVITNSMRLAAALDARRQRHAGLEVFLTGGFLHPESGGLLVGRGAEHTLSQYHADLAFLSVGGICEEGLFNTNESVVDVERQKIARADRAVVMTDHEKVGRRSMCLVCPLDEIDCVVTDQHADSRAFIAHLEKRGIEVECV
jgi:DeoR/GlpR family transcriptional regulator of sugar metabolism